MVTKNSSVPEEPLPESRPSLSQQQSEIIAGVVKPFLDAVQGLRDDLKASGESLRKQRRMTVVLSSLLGLLLLVQGGFNVYFAAEASRSSRNNEENLSIVRSATDPHGAINLRGQKSQACAVEAIVDLINGRQMEIHGLPPKPEDVNLAEGC